MRKRWELAKRTGKPERHSQQREGLMAEAERWDTVRRAKIRDGLEVAFIGSLELLVKRAGICTLVVRHSHH